MFTKSSILVFFTAAVLFFSGPANCQDKILFLPEALQTSLTNYGTIKATTNYVLATEAAVKQSQKI